jgi:hypothetical protein
MRARAAVVLASAVLSTASSTLSSSASPFPPPLLVFVPTGSRTLLFDQNPELVYPQDTADVGGVSHLFVDALSPGLSRLFMELEHRANASEGDARPLGYAVAVTNAVTSEGDARPLGYAATSARGAVLVNITASSFLDTEDGGAPFAAAFNGASPPSSFLVAPGETVLLFRDDALARSVGDIVSGVLDLSTNGTLSLSTLLYLNYSAIPVPIPALSPLPYITRVDAEDEARVYRGVVGVGEVSTLPLAFTLDPSAHPFNTTLPLAYPLYDPVARTYASELTTVPAAVTHSNPLSNPLAVSTDMVASLVLMPGFGFLNPWGCCDGRGAGSIANQANWGVVYHVMGRVGMAAGAGAAGGLVNITVTNTQPGCPAGLAWAPSPGAQWQWKTLWDAPESVTLATVEVPPAGGGVGSFDVAYVLGGPSCGGELLSFVVAG